MSRSRLSLLLSATTQGAVSELDARPIRSRAVQQPLVAAPAAAHAHGRSRCTRVPSSRSSSRRAAVPTALIIRPPAPIRIPFCESVSTQHERAHHGQVVVRLLDVLDRSPRPRAGPPGTCAAAPARGSSSARWISSGWSALLGVREEERALRQELAQVVDERRRRPCRCARRWGRRRRRRRASAASAAPRTVRGRSSRSILLTATTTAQARVAQQPGEEAVARADALLAVDDEQRHVGVGQLALHARLHARGQRVARALHAGQVDEHELARRASWRRRGSRAGSSAACRRRSRSCAPTIALTSVDLPTFGRPPARRSRTACDQPQASSSRLQREHLAVVGLVVHAREVQRPVDDRLAQVGRVLGADHDVAELARTRPPAPRRRRSGRRARRSARPCRGARR